MKRITLPILLGLLLCAAAHAEARTSARDLPRDLEIELALSALPPHLRAEATVYLLGSSGRFEVAREGGNGFHTHAGMLVRLCRLRDVFCLR